MILIYFTNFFNLFHFDGFFQFFEITRNVNITEIGWQLQNAGNRQDCAQGRRWKNFGAKLERRKLNVQGVRRNGDVRRAMS